MVDIVPFTSLLAGTGLGKTIYTANAVVLSTANGGVAVNSNIYVNSSGNVGIGTSVPGTTLDVNGVANFRSSMSVAGTAIVNASVSNVYGYFGQNVTVASSNASASASSGALTVAGGAGIAGNVYASGNVVLATAGKQFWGTTSDTITNPSYSWAGDLQTGMFRPASGTIAFTTVGTERMRIANTGNIGINTVNTSNAVVTINTANAGSGFGTVALLVGTTQGGGNTYVDISSGTYPGYSNSQPATIRFIDDGNFSNHIAFRSKVPGANLNADTERARINTNGNLLVGTNTAPLGSTCTVVINSVNSGGIELVSNNSGGGVVSSVSGGGLNIYTFTGAVGAEAYTQIASITKGGGANGNLAVTGNINATLEITAYYSDSRLKTNVEVISNAVDKIMSINGVYYNPNELAQQLTGESITTQKVGLIAQEVEAVLPQVIRAAPFDTGIDGNSISGDSYKTIQYDKVIPLLVEAIKEQQRHIDLLESRIAKLEGTA